MSNSPILHYREALWKGYQDIVANDSMSLEPVIDIYREVKRTHDGIRPYQADVVIKKRGGAPLLQKPFIWFNTELMSILSD